VSAGRSRVPVVRLTGTVAALLGWSAVVVPALPGAPGIRTAANLAGVAVLVAATRAAGYGWRELGVSRTTWRRGLRWGSGALLVVGGVYGVALAVPALYGLLEDEAVAAMPAGEVVVRALVLIPLGTVLCEELAIRGVLSAVAARALPQPAALVVTAVVFGLWHLVPAYRDGGAGEAVAAVAVTTLGGLVFGLLRQRSGSVLAPMGLHLGTNSLGLLAVVLHQR